MLPPHLCVIYVISQFVAFQNQGGLLPHSPSVSVLCITVISSCCTEVTVHLFLPVKSRFDKGSSSAGCSVHDLEDEASILSA